MAWFWTRRAQDVISTISLETGILFDLEKKLGRQHWQISLVNGLGLIITTILNEAPTIPKVDSGDQLHVH
jgi:hypothetical protein